MAGTKKIVTATMPINGRAKAINARLGTQYADDDTVWVRVQFWEDRAERFMKMLNAIGNPSSVRLVLVGALSVQQYEKDGTVRKNVILNVNDWNLVGNSNSNASKPANNTPAQNQSAPAAPAVSGFDDGGYVDLGTPDGFEDFNGSEDDLPF